MAIHEISLASVFGRVFLAIDLQAQEASIGDTVSLEPPLPSGMKVHECKMTSIVSRCQEGEIVKIRLGHVCQPGWEIHRASGEILEAYEVADQGGTCACFGMRDLEWFETFYGLKPQEFQEVSPGNVAAICQASKSAHVRFELACAVTNQATTQQLEIAPWFAVDKALSE